MGLILPDQMGETTRACMPPEPGLTLAGVSTFQHLDAVEMAARAGFRRVELGAGAGELGDPSRMVGLARTELRRSLREHGVVPRALCSAAAVGATTAALQTSVRDEVRRLIDLAAGLEAPLIVVQDDAGCATLDAVRYALDLLHDLDTDLTRSEVRLALEPGPGSFLGTGAARDLLLRERPSRIGLALADGDLSPDGLSAQAAGSLAEDVWYSRLSAVLSPTGDLALVEEPARALLAALRGSGALGDVSLRLAAARATPAQVRSLYEQMLSFLPGALLP